MAPTFKSGFKNALLPQSGALTTGPSMQNDDIRQIIQHKRNAINQQQKNQLSKTICQRLIQSDQLTDTKHIAIYSPINNEVDTQMIADYCWQHDIACYLPKIDFTTKTLSFALYQQHTTLIKNKLNILEPDDNQTTIEADTLNVVITPLVAFDKNANRLGYGSGYYDRTFAFKHTTDKHKPTLIGIAYELQKVKHLNQKPTDIALNMIVSESNHYTNT